MTEDNNQSTRHRVQGGDDTVHQLRMPTAALRTMARQRGVKRANHIPGGKDALIEAILAVP